MRVLVTHAECDISLSVQRRTCGFWCLQGACRGGGCDPVVGDVDCFAWKVNTPFRQDGSRTASGPPGVIFSVSDCGSGLRTAGSAQRSHEAFGIPGDQCHRVYRCAVFIFCPVCCNASASQRTGGGNVTAWTVTSLTNMNNSQFRRLNKTKVLTLT